MDYIKIPQEYSGFIPGVIPGRVAGVSSPVDRGERLLLNRDWRAFTSRHEKQNMGYETSACLIFSQLDCLEMKFNYLIKNNKISPYVLGWLESTGYLIDGLMNFSDRYAAQFADINPLSGTYQYKAAFSVCENLIPEAMLPYTQNGSYKNPDNTPGGYYNRDCLTAEMKKLSDKFKEFFTITWYYVEDVSDELFYSPLSATVHYADGSGILKPEGRLNHGIAVPFEGVDFYEVDDSYNDQYKRYGKDFVFNFIGFKITINNKTMNIQEFVKKNDLKWVQNDHTGQFGRIMQAKLRPIESSDRGALILLDEKVRNNSIIKDGKSVPAKLTETEWKDLPKLNF